MTLIYSPKGRRNLQGSGGSSTKRETIHRLLSYLSLTYTLFNRDFRSKYRQSLFGVIWAFLLPLLTTIMFVVLNLSGIIKFSEIDVPYAVFALFGITYWSVFATGINLSSSSLINAGSMVVKINFPKSSLVLASSLLCFVEFL